MPTSCIICKHPHRQRPDFHLKDSFRRSCCETLRPCTLCLKLEVLIKHIGIWSTIHYYILILIGVYWYLVAFKLTSLSVTGYLRSTCATTTGFILKWTGFLSNYYKRSNTIFRESSDFDDDDNNDSDDDVATSDGEFVKREGRSKFYEPETLSQASVETEVAEYPTTTGSKDLAGNSNSAENRK